MKETLHYYIVALHLAILHKELCIHMKIFPGSVVLFIFKKTAIFATFQALDCLPKTILTVFKTKG